MASESSSLRVPALQVHIVGIPPAETLFTGQEVHTPRAGATYSFTLQTVCMINEVELHYTTDG